MQITEGYIKKLIENHVGYKVDSWTFEPHMESLTLSGKSLEIFMKEEKTFYFGNFNACLYPHSYSSILIYLDTNIVAYADNYADDTDDSINYFQNILFNEVRLRSTQTYATQFIGWRIKIN